ncbi:MAG TPA: carbohydrate binding family 9 domain-containing protein, partial [Longimicrobiales bacterium]|nr:carbohydrate binding family 9 domain-containing protein [Longimicrobiales bacterium]
MFYLLVTLQLAAALAPPAVYHGRLNQTTVAVPRQPDGGVKVDGTLDEPAWSTAALLTGFSSYQPVDGLPADDSTEVLVWYSEHAMHIGVRAFEPHAPAHATLADRDRITSDDYVYFLLDTFNDRRRAMVFAANPLGVQSDGIVDEGRGGDIDLSPDYLFESKGRVTDYGYELEL